MNADDQPGPSQLDVLLSCDGCGLGSRWQHGFHVESSLSRRRLHFCQRCVVERQRQAAANVAGRMLYVAVFSVAALIAGRVFGGPAWHAVGFALLNLALWMVLTEILLIPHEAAHVGMARILGLRVFEVAIGTGPLIASWPVLGFGVKVHALPFVEGRLVLLKAPFRSEAELDQRVEAYPMVEALAACEEGRLEAALAWLGSAPSEGGGTVDYLFHRGMVLALMGHNAAARDSFQQALATGGDTSPLGPALWNNTAWADTMLGAPDLLEEADTLSRRALEAAPWSRPFKGTRGAVLVWKAAPQEAIPLLREALADPEELHPMAHAQLPSGFVPGTDGCGRAERRRDRARARRGCVPLLRSVESGACECGRRVLIGGRAEPQLVLEEAPG